MMCGLETTSMQYVGIIRRVIPSRVVFTSLEEVNRYSTQLLGQKEK